MSEPLFTPAAPMSPAPTASLANQTLACDAGAAPPPNARPCDIRNIALRFNEVEGGSQAVIAFSTITAAGTAPSLRPRDVGVYGNAPQRIRKLLSSYDLVIEVLAPEAGRPAGAVAARANDWTTRKKDRDDLPGMDAQPTTLLRLEHQGKAACGDPAHDRLSLTCTDTVHHELSGDWPVMGKAIRQSLFSLPATRNVLDLKGIYDSVLDPHRQGNRYIVTGESCGYPASGTATTDLTVLVIALTPGTTGLELGLGPWGWDIGWGYHAAGDARTAAIEADEAERARLAAIADGTGAGSRPRKPGKGASRAARARFKQARADANKARDAARAALKGLRPPPTSRLAGDYWGNDDDDDGLDITVILNDRQLSWEEVSQNERQAKHFLSCVRSLLASAESIKDKLMLALDFIAIYSPSLVRPSASIGIEALALDLFAGRKLTSGNGLDGPRWRALEPYWDIEIAAKVLEITGSLGVTVGKSLIGTGATVELIVSTTGAVSAEFERKGRGGDILSNSTSENEVKGIGVLTLSSALIGRASFLYYDVATGGGSVSGGVRLLATCAVSEVLDGGWKNRLLGDPIAGSYYYDIPLMKRRTGSFVLWKGSDPAGGSNPE